MTKSRVGRSLCLKTNSLVQNSKLYSNCERFFKLYDAPVIDFESSMAQSGPRRENQLHLIIKVELLGLINLFRIGSGSVWIRATVVVKVRVLQRSIPIFMEQFAMSFVSHMLLHKNIHTVSYSSLAKRDI